MNKEELKSIAWIAFPVILIVNVGSMIGPASELGVNLFTSKTIFISVVILSWPVAVLLGGFIAYVFAPEWFFAKVPSVTVVLSGLVLYAFYVVLWTGGFQRSPLDPLVPIVPLLASVILPPQQRLKLLILFAIGVIIVAICSSLESFQPAISYPKTGGWEFSGDYDRLIAAVVVLIGVLVDYFLTKGRSVASGQPSLR